MSTEGRSGARARASSFRHAGAGLATLVREQPNARIHCAATAVVAIAGIWFGLAPLEWCALLLAMVVVWSAEALNTAIEYLADASVPERHPLVGKAKDVAAGGVLLSAIGAAAVGVFVFWPHVRLWISS